MRRNDDSKVRVLDVGGHGLLNVDGSFIFVGHGANLAEGAARVGLAGLLLDATCALELDGGEAGSVIRSPLRVEGPVTRTRRGRSVAPIRWTRQ